MLMLLVYYPFPTLPLFANIIPSILFKNFSSQVNQNQSSGIRSLRTHYHPHDISNVSLMRYLQQHKLTKDLEQFQLVNSKLQQSNIVALNADWTRTERKTS